MLFTDTLGNPIPTNDKPLSHGGEGSIYVVTSGKYKGDCIKYFFGNKLSEREDKINYQIHHQLSAPQNSLYKICWPIDFAYINGKKVGFIMPLAWNGSSSLYDIYLDDSVEIFDRAKKLGVSNRFKILYNISHAINVLHNSGYVLVDFKPENILITNDGKISLIDLDSIQISDNGKLLYRATAFTEDYAYPYEIKKIHQKQAISPLWDSYSFAIVAYQILFGIHPFTVSTNVKDRNGNPIQSRADLMVNGLYPFGSRAKDILSIPPPHYYFYLLDDRLRNIFIQTFSINAQPPAMSIWMTEIARIVNTDSLVENKFRNKPQIPIIIIKNKPKVVNSHVLLEWFSRGCTKILINNVDCTNNTSKIVNVSSTATIIIQICGNNYSDTITIDFSEYAQFCIKCGYKFVSGDLYCINCGCKRMVL